MGPRQMRCRHCDSGNIVGSKPENTPVVYDTVGENNWEISELHLQKQLALVPCRSEPQPVDSSKAHSLENKTLAIRIVVSTEQPHYLANLVSQSG